jgi:HEAT repeat protein
VFAVALLAAALAAAGCTGGGGEDAGAPAGPAEAIEGFSFDAAAVDASFRSIHALERDDPASLREAAMERLDSTDPPVRFAAVYALSLTAEDGPSADALVELLTAERANERLLAAAGLLTLGRPEAIPVLIAALDDETWVDLRDPPAHAWELARSLLLAFTDQDLGLAGAQGFEDVAATKTAWQEWWDANGAGLEFDPAGRVFVEGSG